MLFAPIVLSNSIANRNNNKGSVAYSAIHSLFTGFIFSKLSIIGYKIIIHESILKK